MACIIDGKKIAATFRAELAKQIKKEGLHPKLAVLLIGAHPASLSYVKMKKKYAEEVGISVEVYALPDTVKQSQVKELITQLNTDKTVNGILLQLPVPEKLNARELIETIAIQKDVDGLNPQNVGKMISELPSFVPCTPLGCVYLLKQVDAKLSGKHVVIVGRSALVGRPLAHLLLQENCTVTVAHSQTKNLKKICAAADILISAAGVANLITPSFVKKGAIVIDVGINRQRNGKIVGDVAFDKVARKASYITPVPGGVGPMTVAMLLANTMKASLVKQN